MYWTDWVQNLSEMSKIERAYLDGSNRSQLITKDILWVNGLSIDYQNNILYWCDAYYDRIESYQLDCTDNCRQVSTCSTRQCRALSLISPS